MKKLIILFMAISCTACAAYLGGSDGYSEAEADALLDGKASTISMYSATGTVANGTVDLSTPYSTVPLATTYYGAEGGDYRDVMLRGNGYDGGVRLQIGTGWWTTNAVGTTNEFGTVITKGVPQMVENYAHGDAGFWLSTTSTYDGKDGVGDSPDDPGTTFFMYSMSESGISGKAGSGYIDESPKWNAVRYGTNVTDIIESFWYTPCGTGANTGSGLGYGAGFLVTRQTREDLCGGFRYRKDIGWYSLNLPVWGFSIGQADSGYLKPDDISGQTNSAPYIGNGRIRSARSSAPPANPVGGDMYFDTDDNMFYGYTGSVWTNLY